MDHPRLCGEKVSSFVPSSFFAGSPPPMRGKVQRSYCNCCWTRITPAYAGKRRLSTFLFPATGDHPRLCGEKTFSLRRLMHRKGSPPPMRGKEGCDFFTEDEFGITPAYAGKRQLSAFPLKFVWDHPRLCGEKCRTKKYCNRYHRITPAYAGKSRPRINFPVTVEDHPRLCGEKSDLPACLAPARGSPPPMRGKVFLAPLVLSVIRITPAYAGKSLISWVLHPHG